MFSATANDVIYVSKRFCGPPDSGNGGYVCGLLAHTLSEAPAVECTIRKPIPIECELHIKRSNDSAKLTDGDHVVIEALATDFDLALPAPITWQEASAATKRSPAFHDHPFPTCFVCGPERSEEDGLRIFPGLTPEQPGFPSLFAAEWTPAPELSEDGFIASEFIWAAMDCPTGFAAGFPWSGKLVTGRLTVKTLTRLPAGSRCILQSWSLGNDGRKCHAGAVLRSDSGTTHAIAKATWIRI